MKLIDVLNNREIATAIWLIIIFLWAISIKSVRKSMGELVKIFFNTKIFTPFIAMLLYVSLIIVFFKEINFWDVSAVKDTILWILGTALATFFNLNKVLEDSKYFKNVVIDNLKLMLLLEFIVNFYVFNIWVELILIPAVSILALMNVFAETKPEYKQVKTFLGYVLGIVGLYILAFTFRELVLDFENFATIKNLRDFLLPPLFTFAFLPFVYFMALIMQYESFFTRIDFANKKSVLSKYAKRKVMTTCHLNLSKLNKASRNAKFPKINTKEDVLGWFENSK